jgi:hypothetical protein
MLIVLIFSGWLTRKCSIWIDRDYTVIGNSRVIINRQSHQNFFFLPV